MSVLVKGMKMPTSCWRCTLSQLYDKPREMLVCKITHDEVLRYKIDSNCPLVELPPHGRLIDADAIPYKKIMLDEDDDEFYYGVTQPYIDRMPTIIEADEGE